MSINHAHHEQDTTGLIAMCCYGCDWSFDAFADDVDDAACPFCGSTSVEPFDQERS